MYIYIHIYMNPHLHMNPHFFYIHMNPHLHSAGSFFETCAFFIIYVHAQIYINIHMNPYLHTRQDHILKPVRCSRHMCMHTELHLNPVCVSLSMCMHIYIYIYIYMNRYLHFNINPRILGRVHFETREALSLLSQIPQKSSTIRVSFAERDMQHTHTQTSYPWQGLV